MLQNIGFVFALGQIQVYKRIEGIGFQSVFRLQYQHPLGSGRLLLPLQLRGQRLERDAVLALQDQLDARADLRAPEIGLLPGRRGPPQEPPLRDQPIRFQRYSAP